MIDLPRHERQRRTRHRAAIAVAVTGAFTLLASGCAPDPPQGAVGLVVTGCPPDVANGSGMVISPGLVLTSAHVLKGADTITITNGHRTTAGTIVAFDPEMDLAYVRVEQPLGRGMRLGAAVSRGERGLAYVWRDGKVVTLDVVVKRPITINTEDIYIGDEFARAGWELEADIQPGDSGGAVVVDGRVIGVIWARSKQAERRAYAIDPVRAGALVRSQLNSGVIDAPIDLTRCH